MAKKQSSSYSKHLIAGLFIGVGIYLVIIGILGDMTQSWHAFCIAMGLALQASGSIGMAKLK